MKGLLLKDFYIIRNTIIGTAVTILGIFGLFLVLLCTVGARNGDVAAFLFGALFLTATVMSSVLITSTFQNDEKTGWMQYAFATPVSRKQYLNSKYLFQLAAGLAGGVCSAVFLILCYLITDSFQWNVLLWALFWMVLGTAVSMMAGIWYISLMTKYSYGKASSIVTAVFVSGFFMAIVSGFLLYRLVMPAVTEQKDTIILIKIAVHALLYLLPAAFCIATGILCYKSYRWIEHKEV